MTASGMGHIRDDATVSLGLFLSDLGIRDADNAVICGVAVKTIRRWRRLYQRRGIQRGQTHTSSKCPRCEDAALDEGAYALLLGWYLGDGHLVMARRGVWLLSIYNDAQYPDLNAEIARTMVSVKPGGKVWARTLPGCVATNLGWKHWLCLLPQHGPGMKHTRRIALEEWQREIVLRHPQPFVRGLIHSDGCRSMNTVHSPWVNGARRTYSYPRYFFTNASDDIRGLCCWALDLLGIAWRQSNLRTISVARCEAVAALDEFVGPKS